MVAGAALQKRDECELAQHFPEFSRVLNKAIDEMQPVCKLDSDKLAALYYSVKLLGASLSDYASLLYTAQLKYY